MATLDHMHVRCTNGGCSNLNIDNKLEIVKYAQNVVVIPSELVCDECYFKVYSYPCNCEELGDKND